MEEDAGQGSLAMVDIRVKPFARSATSDGGGEDRSLCMSSSAEVHDGAENCFDTGPSKALLHSEQQASADREWEPNETARRWSQRSYRFGSGRRRRAPACCHPPACLPCVYECSIQVDDLRQRDTGSVGATVHDLAAGRLESRLLEEHLARSVAAPSALKSGRSQN